MRSICMHARLTLNPNNMAIIHQLQLLRNAQANGVQEDTERLAAILFLFH